MRDRIVMAAVWSVWALLLGGAAWGGGGANTGGEWTQWRGPNRDGLSPATGLLKQWGENGPPLLWKTSGLGAGYSSIAIHDGRIFTLGKRRGGTYLIAVSAEDGQELWSTLISAGGGPDPNGTPTVDGDLVYGISTDGVLLCAEAATGNAVWKTSFSRDYGGKMMSGWGYSESPLVDGEWVVFTPGGREAVLVAADKRTGKPVWKAAMPEGGTKGNEGAGYSSIVVAEVNGVKQYIQLVGKGLIAIRAKDGKFLWGYNRIANGTANIPTPIVRGNLVFCSTGYGTGAALLRLTSDGKGGTTPQEVWFLDAKTLQNHHGGMVLVGDYLYGGHGHNNGFPICVEFKTGKVVWNKGRGPGSGSAAVTYADEALYFRYENGTMALIEATPKGYRELGTFAIPKGGNPSWSHPVVTEGRLYLREQGDLMVYDVSAR